MKRTDDGQYVPYDGYVPPEQPFSAAPAPGSTGSTTQPGATYAPVGGPPKQQHKGRRSGLVAAIVLTVFLGVVGAFAGAVASSAVVNGADDAAFDDYTSTQKVASDTLPTPVDPDATGTGTWDDPYELGETLATDEWTITVGTPRPVTTDDLEYPEQSEDPDAGTSYWYVPLDIDYSGPRVVDPWFDIKVEYLLEENEWPDYASCETLVGDITGHDDAIAPMHFTGPTCVAKRDTPGGLWSLQLEDAEKVYFTE